MGNSSYMSVILIVGLIAIFYFMLIRPQQKRMRQQMELINSLRVGDDVMTSSGIYGTITEVEEETVLLEISEDVQIRVAKSAVSRTFTVREEPEEEEEEEEKEAIEEEPAEEETEEAAAEEGEEETKAPKEQGSPNGSSKKKK
jgi:preprotein translocase subunit YajC